MGRFKPWAKYLSWIFFGIIYSFSMMSCASLPERTWESSNALSKNEARQTTLGKIAALKVEEHDSLSGIYALSDSRQAFATRILLASEAEKAIDTQYYIWRRDVTGTLLLKELLDAANRGVKVRMLIDDMNGDELEPLLLALNCHENAQVRLFNPFLHRKVRAIDYVTSLSRINRRMHNKSFTVDNTASIVGGRNVGDEYFGASDKLMFADLDVIAIGPVVNEVSDDFDRYWASESAFPLEKIVKKPAPNSEILIQAAKEVKQGKVAQKYIEAIETDSAIQALKKRELPLVWASTVMKSDDPAKGVGKAVPEALLSARLKAIIGNSTTSLTIVSAYFVPTKAGTKFLVSLAKAGVDVTVLTNSLEATDVSAVHAGYSRYRKRLLKAGVRLYETKSGDNNVNKSMFGSSAASLHAKTFAVDGERIFIGSFNFDPRSVNLNTEQGFIIESEELTSKMEDSFETAPVHAYELQLNEKGNLYWIERDGATILHHYREPYTNWWKRFTVKMLAILPIEWLL